MTSIETYLRYQDVFGAASTAEQFETTLRSLDLDLVLRLFGPINTVLFPPGIAGLPSRPDWNHPRMF
jgi:hypothetical protein